jgi:hypothetical protein
MFKQIQRNRRQFSDTLLEAFNVIGYAISAKPASIKNYRDEFDPLFPNRRKGWHNRKTRAYCLEIFQEYKTLDFESFTGLIESFVDYDENIWSGIRARKTITKKESSFAQRLITGLAAEQYFERVLPTLPQFLAYSMQNTTRLGCGYDFRLHLSAASDFLAFEVKGLKQKIGGLSLTPKEYEAAAELKDRFFLFVVKNFQESPYHEIFQNPLASKLRFIRKERVSIYLPWETRV